MIGGKIGITCDGVLRIGALAVLLVTLVMVASSLPVVLADSTGPELFVTKVFYLQGMELRDAATLLRKDLDIRASVMVASRNALVVSDVAGRVDKAESLLREKNAVVQVGVPHGPLQREPRAKETEERVFKSDSQSIGSAVVILRAIYLIVDLKKDESSNSITIRAPKPVLDASESLLGSLGLLEESKAAAKP